jgi:hypothetical protein
MQASLERLRSDLANDPSESAAFRAFHRLLALSTVGNARAHPSPGALAPADAPTGSGATLPERWDSATDRYAAIVGEARELFRAIAERIGAKGYSIAVSVSWGISFQVEFSLPGPGTGPRPPGGSAGPGAPPCFM